MHQFAYSVHGCMAGAEGPLANWLKSPFRARLVRGSEASLPRVAMAVMMPRQFQALINHFAGALGAQQQQCAEQGSKGKLKVRGMRVQDFEVTAAARGGGPSGSRCP